MTIEPQMLSLLIEGYQQHGAAFALDDYALRKLAWRLDHLLVSAEQLEKYADRLFLELDPIDKKQRNADEQTTAGRDYLVPLTDEVVERVLDRPLWSRHTSELRPLLLPLIAINPVALTQLQEELSEDPSQTWDHLIEEEEQRLCRVHGLSSFPDEKETAELAGLRVRDDSAAPNYVPSQWVPIAATSDGIAWNGEVGEPESSGDEVGLEVALADSQHLHFNVKTSKSPGLLHFEASGALPERPLLIEAQPGISKVGTYLMLLRLGGVGYVLPGTRVTLRLHDEDGQPLSNVVILPAEQEDPIFIIQWRGESARPFFPGDRLEIAFDGAGPQTYRFSGTVEL